MTDEMVRAIEVFMAPMEEQDDTRKGIAAVLAIVERDHDVMPGHRKASPEPHWNPDTEQYTARCTCGVTFTESECDRVRYFLYDHIDGLS